VSQVQNGTSREDAGEGEVSLKPGIFKPHYIQGQPTTSAKPGYCEKAERGQLLEEGKIKGSIQYSTSGPNQVGFLP